MNWKQNPGGYLINIPNILAQLAKSRGKNMLNMTEFELNTMSVSGDPHEICANIIAKIEFA